MDPDWTTMSEAAGSDAAAFRNSLKDLYHRAGEPKQTALIARIRLQRPQSVIKPQTLSNWVNGVSVPATWDVVEILVTCLQASVERKPGDHPTALTEWRAMYKRAQDELRATRRGRPGALTGVGRAAWPSNEAHSVSAVPDDEAHLALGPLGHAHLSEMLSVAGIGESVERWTIPRLHALALTVSNAEPVLRAILRSTIEDFVVTLKTGVFLQEWIPQTLTTKHMRDALRLPGVAPDLAVLSLRTLVDYLEWIALHTPGSAAGLRRRLARLGAFLLEGFLDLGQAARSYWCW
jgi:hypothetical protein